MLNSVYNPKKWTVWETCKIAVLLNAFLSLHTTQTAMDKELTDLRCLSITSAQITDLPINHVGAGKTLESQALFFQEETKQK